MSSINNEYSTAPVQTGTAPTHTTTSTSTGTTAPGNATTGAAGGNSVVNGIKGAWNTFHGAGEMIRGNFNAGVDSIGEGIAGRNDPNYQAAPRPTSAETAKQGENEFSSGLGAFHTKHH